MINGYFIAILFILIGGYLLDLIVEILNIRYAKEDVPEEFMGFYDKEKYRKSQAYLKDNTRFNLIDNTFSMALVIVFIFIGGFNFVDQWARSFNLNTVFTGLIFAGVILLANQIIQIPFSYYHTFVIEAKYGFNKTSVKTFMLDIIKGWFLTAIIAGTIFSLIILFFEKTGNLAWIYCWLAVTIIEIFLVFIAPVVIMPLFNKFTPMPEGELKTAIFDYVQKEKFAIKGLFTMDGSKRSTKSNAFFTGFGKYRRIVLFDTLIAKHTVKELVAILAHEIGHYKKRHIIKMLGLSILTNGLMFYILSLFINNSGLFAVFGMKELSIYASLFFFAFLYSPINMILSVVNNVLSRCYEYEADRYSINTYPDKQAFILALKKLTVDNLSNLTPHPLKVFLEYSHPPVLKRIAALKK